MELQKQTGAPASADTTGTRTDSTDTNIEDPSEPWKTAGYPALSRWMASSNDFLVLRRFAPVAARIALMMQDELMQMETELRTMDEFMASQPKGFGGSGSFRLDKGSPREKLLSEMIPKLKEYYDFLDSFSRIKSQQGAERFQIQNVRNWFWNNSGAILETEQEFIAEDKEGDLIALVDRPKALLRQLLENFTGVALIFRIKTRADRVQSASTRYYSDRWFDVFTSATIVLGGLIMLFIPMWWLNNVSNSSRQLGIITGFVLLFAILLFGATTRSTKGFEVMAATAAYAAVLAVYLQNGTGESG